MCATALRSFVEWDQHPQAKALAHTPPVTLIKIGDAPKREIAGTFSRPLDGIRVLDLSRVLAGPVAGRTLAGWVSRYNCLVMQDSRKSIPAHGADVLLVTSPNLPALPHLDVETSLGKRTIQLDLTVPTDREVLKGLVKDADVFLQAYRPGGMEAKGFGAESLVAMRPGIVCANLTAWGWEGPWKDRRGVRYISPEIFLRRFKWLSPPPMQFDSLVQTATGFNVAESEAFNAFEGRKEGHVTPRPLPMQALDHTAGYLLAFGINAALCKTITVGIFFVPCLSFPFLLSRPRLRP